MSVKHDGSGRRVDKTRDNTGTSMGMTNANTVAALAIAMNGSGIG